MTEIERNCGMTQAQITSQIAENRKKIDEHLKKLHEVRLHIEEMRKQSDERVKKYLANQ